MIVLGSIFGLPYFLVFSFLVSLDFGFFCEGNIFRFFQRQKEVKFFSFFFFAF